MIATGLRRAGLVLGGLLIAIALWELYLLVGPEDGGELFGAPVLPRAARMPHVWDVAQRFTEPEVRGGDDIWRAVAAAAWFTFRLSIVGFVIGAAVGLGLGVLMARFRVVERGLLPYLIVSQTVPLIALAPLVMSWGGRIQPFGWEWPRWLSASVMGAFLAFFPVAVGTLRGLRSTPPAAVELMDTYAASWRTTLFKLRFPAAMPYITPALKLSATASVIGVIVSEISTGLAGGIGRLVISYMQAGSGDPTKVYTAIVGAVVLGLALFGLVSALDAFLMRNRPKEVA